MAEDKKTNPNKEGGSSNENPPALELYTATHASTLLNLPPIQDYCVKRILGSSEEKKSLEDWKQTFEQLNII